MLKQRGAFNEAEPLRRRGLEAQERLLGPEHPETLVALFNLASVLQLLGRLSEALYLRRAAAVTCFVLCGEKSKDRSK